MQSVYPIVHSLNTSAKTESFIEHIMLLCPGVLTFQGSTPPKGPHCTVQLFIPTYLISHARISEPSTILINVSCFSAPPAQRITHMRTLGGAVRVIIGSDGNSHILGRQSVCPPKDYRSH